MPSGARALTMRVQSTQLLGTWGFYIRNLNTGVGSRYLIFLYLDPWMKAQVRPTQRWNRMTRIFKRRLRSEAVSRRQKTWFQPLPSPGGQRVQGHKKEVFGPNYTNNYLYIDTQSPPHFGTWTLRVGCTVFQTSVSPVVSTSRCAAGTPETSIPSADPCEDFRLSALPSRKSEGSFFQVVKRYHVLGTVWGTLSTPQKQEGGAV